MNVLTQLQAAIEQASQQYHRLVLLVGASGTGKTRVLNGLADENGWAYRNVNLELSQKMLELSRKQRARQIERLMQEIAADVKSALLLLDNIEILFDKSLSVDPLRLLKSISRNQTVVATWNGDLEDGFLTYAEPHHPEHRSYRESDVDVIVVQLNAGTKANI